MQVRSIQIHAECIDMSNAVIQLQLCFELLPASASLSDLLWECAVELSIERIPRQSINFSVRRWNVGFMSGGLNFFWLTIGNKTSGS
jgi:hypothetical protein